MNAIKNVSMVLLGTAVVTLVAENTVQTSAIAASLVRVSQESAPGMGDFDDNVLGFIEAFSSSETIKDTYNYNRDNSSFQGPLALTSNVSHLFLAEATDGLGLFSVHDKPRPDNQDGQAQMQFNLLGDTASILVKDEPESLDLDDRYTVNDSGTAFTIQQRWGECCTDGFAIGYLDGDWTMFAQFTTAPNGLDSWLAFSAASSESPIELVIDPGRRVRLDFPDEEQPPVSVPEHSSAFSLLAFGLVGAGWRLKRKLQGNVRTSSSSAD